MKSLTRSSVLAVAIALGGPGLAAQQPHQHDPAKPEKSAQAQHQQQGDFDLRFLEMTAMHHEMGVKLAGMADSKAENAELKAKAKQMHEEQRQEIAQLDQLRGRLYPDAGQRQSAEEMMQSMHRGQGTAGQGHQQEGQAKGSTGSTGMHHPSGDMEGMMSQFNRLEQLQGAEFDRAFAKLMIQHHQMQVKMSQRAMKDAKHDEVKSIASETLTRQKRDIADLQKFAGPGKSNK